MLSLQSPVSCRTTFPSTKSSARISAILQLPPIKNLKVCPPMTKLGDVSVPWGPSPCVPPARWEGLGRSSKPPIHQSPLCLDGWPRFRAVGLSPYVGWLLNAVPVLIQPDKPFSKSNRVQPFKKTNKTTPFCLYSSTKDSHRYRYSHRHQREREDGASPLYHTGSLTWLLRSANIQLLPCNGRCNLSTSCSQNWAILPKRIDNGLLVRS